jgi:hypothetical protein
MTACPRQQGFKNAQNSPPKIILTTRQERSGPSVVKIERKTNIYGNFCTQHSGDVAPYPYYRPEPDKTSTCILRFKNNLACNYPKLIRHLQNSPYGPSETFYSCITPVNKKNTSTRNWITTTFAMS